MTSVSMVRDLGIMSLFQDSDNKEESPSNNHDECVGLTASILLDDTSIARLRPEGGKRISQTAATKAIRDDDFSV
ncbi:uncharacterized protein RAG0_10981 [Rhynchosporium agropyri]|uniref:Uncharacterized protein n=2 Tax=Rhynchosporium TaxID=38037 RepID=A0A1E1L243_9HELO|nr:uncharacterized protein RAG0_10981 [Rhynchosporium agropyri]CZT09548.1 uncharacterized protein RCO7_15029 [Rhynchosporium commune]